MRAAVLILVGSLACGSGSPADRGPTSASKDKTEAEPSSKVVGKKTLLAPDNWREILPQLDPRASAFGELCKPWDRRECEKLCDEGSALSCARLGTILLVGGAENPILPVPEFDPDPKGARARWKAACEAGYQVSCIDLAWLLSTKHGGPIDVATATKLRTEACKAGYGAGCRYLAADESDPKKSRELYEKACDQGDTNGCLEAGGFYEIGEGVPEDMSRALKFYSRAFFAPVKADVALGCPKGTSSFREVRETTYAYTIAEVALYCGRPGERRPEKHGPFIEFGTLEDEAVHGVASSRGNYIDGEKEGAWETYDDHGRLRSKTNYRGGREHGTKVEYRPQDSNYSETIEYVDGKRHGPHKTMRSNGHETGAYKHGKKHGTWTRVYEQDKTVTNYESGRIVGDQIEYYPDGSVHHRIPHDAQGRRHGSYSIYTKTGALRGETLYAHGERTTARWYHDNGKLSSETLYKNDEEISSRRFDSKGRPVPDDD